MTREIKGQVIIYSIVGCPFCIRAKAKLDELGLPFFDLNLDKNPAARNDMIERTGKKTVPQIFFNAIHVGGYNDLVNLSSQELEKLIKEVSENEAPFYAPKISMLKNDSVAEEAADDFEFTCELDEYAAIVKEIKESGLVKDIRQTFTTHKNAFIGREVVDWLVSHKNLDRAQAMEMCKILIDRHFGHSVKGKGQVEFRDDDTIYRFLEDTESNALNSGLKSDCEPRPATLLIQTQIVIFTFIHYIWIACAMIWKCLRQNTFFLAITLNPKQDSRRPSEKQRYKKASEVGEELRKLILILYNENLSPDGRAVDYQGISKSDKFKAYVKHTAELHRVKLDGITREEKVAFFINIYNALVIHAFVSVGPPANLWQRYKFFNVVSYIIGGHIYSLNEIENGVLRANRKPIGAFRKPFSKSDPRFSVALLEPEPRIHFALVCGAKSCPPIKTYSARDLDQQLNLATEAFLESDDGCTVDYKKKVVRLSQILKWYKEDFGSNKEEIVRWVYEHMGDCEKKIKLHELMCQGFKLGHMPYNWSVNSK